mmetsp:Transcript_26412/g.57616  ORF Transcript_26412/g.57616 Transcript_26412/m.57616 type:complete len:279 (-) Transcript_26412:109-945(-)
MHASPASASQCPWDPIKRHSSSPFSTLQHVATRKQLSSTRRVITFAKTVHLIRPAQKEPLTGQQSTSLLNTEQDDLLNMSKARSTGLAVDAAQNTIDGLSMQVAKLNPAPQVVLVPPLLSCLQAAADVMGSPDTSTCQGTGPPALQVEPLLLGPPHTPEGTALHPDKVAELAHSWGVQLMHLKPTSEQAREPGSSATDTTTSSQLEAEEEFKLRMVAARQALAYRLERSMLIICPGSVALALTRQALQPGELMSARVELFCSRCKCGDCWFAVKLPAP